MHKEDSVKGGSRRSFVSGAAIGGVGLILIGNNSLAQPPATAQGKSKPSDVNATEDLMREHGVLNRVLLIYEEGIRRINSASPPSADVLATAAGIIQKFIEAYHEKLEEEEVFPRLEKLGKLTDLTQVVRERRWPSAWPFRISHLGRSRVAVGGAELNSEVAIRIANRED